VPDVVTEYSLAEYRDGDDLPYSLSELMMDGPPELAFGTILELLRRADSSETCCSIGTFLLEALFDYHLPALIDHVERLAPTDARLRWALYCCTDFDAAPELDARVARLRPERGSEADFGLAPTRRPHLP
jgi:hypothetical protein